MSIRIRTLAVALAASVASATAAPVPSGNKYEPPTAVMQAVSGQQILDQIKEFVRSIDPRTADEMDRGIASALGDKMWAGLDMTRPIGGYAYLRPKLEHSYPVFVVPITSEKEALDLLERLKFEVAEERSHRGVYRLRMRNLTDDDEVAWRVRFADKHAYLGINVDPEELDEAKLVPPSAVIDPREKATFAGKLFLDRCPKELMEAGQAVLAEGRQSVAQLDVQRPPDMPASFPPLAREVLDWCERNLAASFRDGETLEVRYMLESKATDAGIQIVLTPKGVTKLAEDIAAVKPAAGRFHQLTAKDALGGFWLTLPQPPLALREKVAPFAADMMKMAEQDTPEPFQAVVGELGKALEAAVSKGELDAGAAVLGPNADGLYTAVVAVGLADPAALEKAVKDAVKTLPNELQGLIKLDAEKAGEVSVHTVQIPEVPEELQKLLGKTPTVRLGFGAGAVYAGIGPDGLAQIKRAVALKPSETKAVDFVINPAKVNKLLSEAAPAEVAQVFGKMLGQDDALRSQMGINITGGKALTLTWGQYRTLLFGGFAAPLR